MVYDTQSRYLAEINGETFPGTFKDPKSPVRTAAISFPAPQAGSQVHTSLQAILNESSALYGETRIAIFTLYEQEKRPVPVQTSVNTSVPGKSENVSSSQRKNKPWCKHYSCPEYPGAGSGEKTTRTHHRRNFLRGVLIRSTGYSRFCSPLLATWFPLTGIQLIDVIIEDRPLR